MSTERWNRLADLFHGALEQPPAVRSSWLETACAGYPELRRDVDALLDAHATAGDFLEQPVTIAADADDPQLPRMHAARAAPGAIAPADPAPGVRQVRRRATDDADPVSPDDSPLRPGSQVGPYTIVEEIGRGGMGIVYLAEDRRLGRPVALKALPPAVAGRHDLRERLRREARAAATISHPAIAVVHALEELGDHLFIVSEYVRGHTLRSEIDAGPLPLPRALAIAGAIASGLAAAHDAGVIHRDLKPENILIGDPDIVKVVDFGIAYIEAAEGARLTRADATPGTPGYMAPEQLLGGDADSRADVYAFGIVLAEMLTGRGPAARWHGQDDDVPRQLTAIIDRCLQPAPHARYRSARQLLHALERASPPLPGGTARLAPAPVRTTPRWWWEFHQAVAALVYWLLVIPAWSARGLIGGTAGRVFFVATLAAVIVSANLRFHLWFTSRFYPVELAWVRARSGRWIRAGDWVFALTLTTGGLLVDDRWSAVSVLLIAFGIGSAVAFLLIEPVTTRAAFRSRSQ